MILRWATCLAVVLGLHAGVVVLLRHGPSPVLPPPSADAVMMDLAPETVPAGPSFAPSQPEAQIQPGAAAPPPVAEPTPPPQPAPQPPPPAEPATPPPPTEPAPQALAPEAPRLPEPPVPPPARPAPRRPAPQRAVTLQSPVPAEDRSPEQAFAPPTSNGMPGSPTPGSASSAAPAARASSAVLGWRDLVAGRIERAKRYPEMARERNEQGVATATFIMDRSGAVLSVTLDHSSGSQELDEEAIAMIHRAAPLPPIPAELAGDTIKLTLPLSFSLR